MAKEVCFGKCGGGMHLILLAWSCSVRFIGGGEVVVDAFLLALWLLCSDLI